MTIGNIKQEVAGFSPDNAKNTLAVLPLGTIVLTLRGALPVENLRRGDRVVTELGGAALKRVHSLYDEGCCRLEFHEPQTVYVLDSRYSSGGKTGQDAEKGTG
jgi:hypothetical protein